MSTRSPARASAQDPYLGPGSCDHAPAHVSKRRPRVGGFLANSARANRADPAVAFFSPRPNRTTFAADSRWLPSIIPVPDPPDDACFHENKFGTTRIALCAYGVPTTTQIAFNAYNKTVNDLPAPKAWITIQDHSIALVKNTAAPGDKPEVWSKPQSYFASTNDGGSEFMGQTTSTWFGTKQGDENTGASAVRSAMSYGYTSYAPIDRCTETFGYTNETAATKTDAEIMSEKSITHEEVDLIRKHCNGTYDQKLRENQFMTMTGGGGGYWLN